MRRQLERILGGRHLDESEACELFVELSDACAPRALAGAVLAALRMKGETADELRGFARAMRRAADACDIPRATRAVDVVGTGGDGSGSLNLSTGAALLAAACGAPVVKHGNRAVSSRSGSADVLEALGFALPADGPAAAASLAATGFAFLFAPHFHPAMQHVAPVRRALGVRTVFNLLGPLTNPAAPPFGVIGACTPRAAELLAGALAGLPIRRVFVVHGDNGWDEATPVGPFTLHDVRPGAVRKARRDPADVGIRRCAESALAGGDAVHNAACLRRVFAGERGAHRDALVLGAALALEVTGLVTEPAEGRACAEAALDGGAASRLIDALERLPAGNLAATGGGRG